MAGGDRTKGIVYRVISAVCYGTVPLFTLPLYAAGLSPYSTLLYRFFFAGAALALLMLFRRQSFRLRRDQLLPALLMGLCCALSALFLFEAYRYMDAGVATTLLYVYPIMVAVIMAIFYKERITWVTVLSIVIALGGILLLCRPTGGRPLSWLGLLFVFLAALADAVYIVGIGQSSLKDLEPAKLTFWMMFVGIIVFIASTGFFTRFQLLPARPIYWIEAVCLGIVPTVLALTLMTYGIRYIGATASSILGAALEPLTALFIGVTVFGEAFNLRVAVGVLLIIVAVILVIAAPAILSRFGRRGGQ